MSGGAKPKRMDEANKITNKSGAWEVVRTGLGFRDIWAGARGRHGTIMSQKVKRRVRQGVIARRPEWVQRLQAQPGARDREWEVLAISEGVWKLFSFLVLVLLSVVLVMELRAYGYHWEAPLPCEGHCEKTVSYWRGLLACCDFPFNERLGGNSEASWEDIAALVPGTEGGGCNTGKQQQR